MVSTFLRASSGKGSAVRGAVESPAMGVRIHAMTTAAMPLGPNNIQPLYIIQAALSRSCVQKGAGHPARLFC